MDPKDRPMTGQNNTQPVKLTRRAILGGAIAAGAVAAAPMINRNAHTVFAGSATPYSSRAIGLVEKSLVIDMLGLITINEEEFNRWITPEGMGEEDREMFRTCGINVFHHAFGIQGGNAHADTLAYLARWNGFIARYSDLFSLATTVAEMENARAQGKIAVLMGVQNADHFRTVEDVALFHGLGQRCAQLTYNSQNLLGSGATDRVDGGISDFGAAIVTRMNETGMLVDVSHSGDQTTLDAIELSTRPIAITHSNCRALNDHPRLKTDEAIVKLAARDGVMGITGVRNFVRDREPTTVDHMIEHIDHVARLTGIEHVGIGTDTDLKGYDALPDHMQKSLRGLYKDSYAFRDRLDTDGLDHPQKIYDLTEGLIRKGYTDDQIEAVLGGNFKRLLQTIIG